MRERAPTLFPLVQAELHPALDGLGRAFPALPPRQKAAQLVPEDAFQRGLRVEGEGSLARASIECSLHTARIAEILIACNSASCIKI